MQTDGHDEGNSRFSQFCEHAKKCTEPFRGNSAITVYTLYARCAVWTV